VLSHYFISCYIADSTLWGKCSLIINSNMWIFPNLTKFYLNSAKLNFSCKYTLTFILRTKSNCS
jgi:hypothetical protein